jgi:dTMP kinase
MPQQTRGKFITFEGLDGSGLTEQVELLKDWLRKSNYDLNQVEFTHEPSEGPVGLLLRMTLQGRLDMDEEAIALLFAADRQDHLSRFIEPRLNKGRHVVSDRYYLSFYAYQAVQGVSSTWLRQIGERWRKPDLAIFLDTPLEQCWRNVQDRFEQERYEIEQETLKKTEEEFRRLINILSNEGESIEIVNGKGPGEQVHQRILPLLRPIFDEENVDGG